MIRRFCTGTLLALSVAAYAQGQGAAAPGAASTLAAGEDLTVITSDRLTFDYKNHFALFEVNVVVVDPQMKIFADKMTVNFDENNKAKTITAEGKVNIIQEDKKSHSDTATYDVPTGKIVLRGTPRVTRGRDILTAEVITFWRDENKMLCEPRARLVIYPNEGGGSGGLDGIMGSKSGGK